MEQVLSRQQAELVALERRLVLHARDALLQVEGSRADADRLATLVDEMDELFLLVIVGEYNSGKSTFINALLGDEVFAMGDLPTTREIAILRHGEAQPPEAIGDHTLLFHYPIDFLRDLEIVDTPGTNSLERMEEELTRSFVPRADLVLFVTSLLQPLTASELAFLMHIRDWGRKVIVVVNGVDRRNSDEQIDRVRQYLDRELAARLGSVPAMYFISALASLRAKIAARGATPAGSATAAPGGSAAVRPAAGPGGSMAAPDAVPADPRNEFPILERYLLETLREHERVRLKLLSPLGVLRHILERNAATLETRLEVVHADGRVLGVVRQQLETYGTEMRTDSERYLLEVRGVLAEVERRGRSWLERTIRIGNLNFLRNRDAVENRFRAEVVGDAPRQIEDVVNRMVDWTVKRNLKLWTAVFQELDAHTARLRASGALAAHASTEFQYNREELFDRLRQPVERRLNEFNAEAEARQVVESVREAVTHAFGINVLAVGLGAVVMAVFTTAALDITGLLTATLFALAGWLLIPARRRRLIRELEEKIAKLSADLSALLSAKFNEQLARYEREMLDIVLPYERFLASEQEKLERGLGELRASQQETTTLERRVVETFPEGERPETKGT